MHLGPKADKVLRHFSTIEHLAQWGLENGVENRNKITNFIGMFTVQKIVMVI